MTDDADGALGDGDQMHLVRVIRAVCLQCGQETAGITGPNGEDLRFPALVEARWLYEMGVRRPHSWSCEGQMQLETESPA